MIKPHSMDDYGKRIDHLLQLQDIWSSAYAILTARGWHSAREQMQAEELEIALRLLGNYLTFNYSELGIARAINALPENPEEIK